VSPVTGRLDAFQWQTPVAALPSDKSAAIEATAFEQAMLAPSRRVEPPREPAAEAAPPPAAQDNSPANPPPPAPAAVEPAPTVAAAPSPPPAEPPSMTAAPLFRARQDIPRSNPASIPAVIPIVRPPDDPGIDEEAASDEFAEQLSRPSRQAGGWRGFLARWGG
jgi:HemY protein